MTRLLVKLRSCKVRAHDVGRALYLLPAFGTGLAAAKHQLACIPRDAHHVHDHPRPPFAAQRARAGHVVALALDVVVAQRSFFSVDGKSAVGACVGRASALHTVVEPFSDDASGIVYQDAPVAVLHVALQRQRGGHGEERGVSVLRDPTHCAGAGGMLRCHAEIRS